MNRNKKGVMPEITREVYKGVKKFDRQQFMSFCTDLYKFGYEDGRESIPAVDVEEIMTVIGSINGIGEKRMAHIREGVEALFAKGDAV